MPEKVRITYVRSAIGRVYRQKRVIRALGFTRLQQSRIVEWNSSIKGMVNKVIHLLKIEPVKAVPVNNDSDDKTSTDVVEIPINSEIEASNSNAVDSTDTPEIISTETESEEDV